MNDATCLLARVTSPGQPIAILVGFAAVTTLGYGVYRLVRWGLWEKPAGKRWAIMAIAVVLALPIALAIAWLVMMTGFLLFWDS